MKHILLLVLFFSLSACWTMHFTKEGAQPLEYSYSKWHHIGLLGLMEFSDPADLKSICGPSGWQAARVQTGFLQGLVRLISIPTGQSYYNDTLGQNIPLPVVIGRFYSPEELSWQCASAP